jgi:hypothetical protein
MPIENRELAEGTRLVARHKGKEHVCEVVETKDGLRYRVDDPEYKDFFFNSPSSAGRAVTGGVSVNGWRFWSLEGTLKPAKERKPKTAKPKAEKPATATKTKTAKAVKPKAKKKGKKSAKKKVARAASHDSYGCGVCPETFPTLKAATQHALTHTQ